MNPILLHISQALTELNKRTNYTWTWEDILRHHANGLIRLQCKLNNVPYVISHYEHETNEEYALCTHTTHYTVGVFNGYVDLTATEDGIQYLKALATQAPTKGFYSFIDFSEQHYFVADKITLDKIIDEYGFEDEDYEMVGEWLKLEFEHLPTGTLTISEPTEKHFYIQDFVLELFIEWFNKDNSYKSNEKELKVEGIKQEVFEVNNLAIKYNNYVSVTNNYQILAIPEHTTKDTTTTTTTATSTTDAPFEAEDSKDKPYYYYEKIFKINVVDLNNAKEHINLKTNQQDIIFKEVIKDLGIKGEPCTDGRILLGRKEMKNIKEVLHNNGFTQSQARATISRNNYVGEDNAPDYNQARMER